MKNKMYEIIKYFGKNAIESIHLKDDGLSIYFREKSYTELKKEGHEFDFNDSSQDYMDEFMKKNNMGYNFNFLENNFRELRPVLIRNRLTGIEHNHIVLIARDNYGDYLICKNNKGFNFIIPLSKLNEWEWKQET